jgi:murein DD-endopeptidase MepM/ murein hydrolase activator NlpD
MEIARGMEEVSPTLGCNSAAHKCPEKLLLELPMATILKISSMFGKRDDPLPHTPAFHGGAGFKGNYGKFVMAPAARRVTRSSPHGPYGDLV